MYNSHMTMYNELDDPSAAAQELASSIYAWPANSSRYAAAFPLINRLREEVDALELELVADARSERFTWQEIGSWMGTSRQGAFNRFGGAVPTNVDPAALATALERAGTKSLAPH